MEPSRREILVRGSRLLLAVPAGWVLAHSTSACEDECEGADTVATSGDTLTVTSSCDSGHVHSVDVTMTELAAPPAGGTTKESTSYEGEHTHRVTLTEAQMTSIAGGSTVAVVSTVDAGHSHTFTFHKA